MGFAPTKLLLFIGRSISGLTGASMTVASSFIADISDEKNRSSNFGMIGAGWGIGFILGPMLGGFLGTLGPKAPFIAAAAMNFLNFLFGVFVLPESLSAENRRELTIDKLNPWKLILKYLKPSPFVVLIWVYFFIFLAAQVHPVNWTLYTQLKFGWSAWEVGLSLSFAGVVVALSQIFLTRILIPRLGEERSITIGLLSYAICFVLFGCASSGWMMYAILILFAFPGITMPSIQSKLASYIPGNQQGELQGSLVALGSFSSILAPMIFTYLFVEFTKDKMHWYFPGAAYVAAGVICLIALLLWQTLRSK
jgi:DHA1 family tetracycline resistance protein-like MFS transporter